MSHQLKTARLTVLLDPSRKQAFERVCRANDMTPSQVLRHLIRDFIDAHTIQPQTTRAARQPATAARLAAMPAKRANARG